MNEFHSVVRLRQLGLIQSCWEISPYAAHHHYLRHFWETFKKVMQQMCVVEVEFLCQKMYTSGNTDNSTRYLISAWLI